MDTKKFLDFLEACCEVGGDKGASTILFELSREEMETNSKYSSALASIKKCLGIVPSEIVEGFKEVMKDENDHCLKFQLYASHFTGIKIGNINQ